ncbi:1-(5-phosphoribosyl)-5-[(5-phosphoribosylamino)methylideneamino]imidazole-4-carboxamide isomerase [Methanopyrus kandleri]|uniref:1-(5-phosphoribosyl)-5-[(5-phosphoribosylamino)methylideneamino] imidazole-4-carboxamide isomerase n=2 Tax=Methanopyrus kandleri TaxID=2320 RepID=HIS4_METKA|nr:1-(5-phosphoribosyl)-5-[(5-phosphoribosylamino)methylideneamino]imidazole-4-carboxamide isomerase [Methanopyrus kandleri]Q8TYD6.1 RecName: Full=1-(5-phosphoribosyl)-5-[(5-phosphoribosylamino)methylideneamino] imidazole-4-carboxamide isomerase; AltName: Full=Phosphoribosylformimino-5-aminoimidazole carboxamide ribotide isomerase [Methanopyrus kandleri AV19]AAM01579.1 Phosphoribosylformimino-5-aminoimidazole carboxamide ribonucleotide (ProFAR) isomerase [Methanopyrus kandleri AV19]HII70482.1 1-
MAFVVIPSVDVVEGKCVQLVEGDPERRTFESDDPVETAHQWSEFFPWIHVVDVDAARGEGDNSDIIGRICEEVDAKVQVGGGIRSAERAEELIELGADRLIVGTVAFTDKDDFSKIVDVCHDHGIEVFVALDVNENHEVLVSGWKEDAGVTLEDAIERFNEVADGYLTTAVHVEGKEMGIDEKVVEKSTGATDLPVLYAGGIASIKDVKRAKEAGAYGVVIGTALYHGDIDPVALLDLMEED